MNINIFSKIDDKGNTYWTATFDKVPEVIGGGNTPQKALKEGLKNLKYFKKYLKEINKWIVIVKNVEN